MRRTLVTLSAIIALLSSGKPSGARGTISLDVRDLDIYDTVRLLSTQAAVNVVLDASVIHHPVTLRLRDITFYQALATLAQTNDLEIVTVGNVVYLGASDVMNRRYPSNERSGNTTVVFALKNGVPADVARSLTDALPKGSVVEPDARTSSVIVSGPPATIQRARNFVEALDAASRESSTAVPMRYVKASDALKALEASMAVAAPDSAYASDEQNEILLGGSDDFVRGRARS